MDQNEEIFLGSTQCLSPNLYLHPVDRIPFNLKSLKRACGAIVVAGATDLGSGVFLISLY
jgi:hypothetical protein